MDSNPSLTGPSLTETDFLTIVTFIKGELSRILATASSVDSIKTYISNLVKYIEATEQSTDLTFSDTEDKGENGSSRSGSRTPVDKGKRIAPPTGPTAPPVVVIDEEKPDIVKQSLQTALMLPPDDPIIAEIAEPSGDVIKTETIDDDEETGIADEGAPAEAMEELEETIEETPEEEKPKDKLTCIGCGKRYHTEQKLKDHIKRNPGKKRFKCSGCCKAFKHKVSLRLHKVEEDHGLDTEHPAELEKFLKKLFVCEVCKKRFLGQGNLDRHMLTHTGSKPYHCTLCDKQFRQKRSLLQHTEREHDEVNGSLTIAVAAATKNGKSTGKLKEKLFRCKKCDRVYTSQNQLNSHMKVHAKGAQFGCNSCGRFFTRKETLEKHLVRDCSGDVFPVAVKCGMCEEKFMKKSQLDMHLSTHLETPLATATAATSKANPNINMENFMHNAETSNYGNDEINALANQIAQGILGPEGDSAAVKSENPPVKRRRGRQPGSTRPPYQCQYCPKIFNRRKEWRNHQYLHTGEKPHVCDICGKTFRLRQVLTLHIDTHGGNKYKCNICDKTYPYKNQLVRHSYTHSGIKPYKCEQCGKGFISKPELNRHYGVDGGGKTFVCDICGKSCRNIKKHMLAVHTEREKVRCEICQKEYVSKSKLKVHMMTHTTTKSFICPICGKGFAMNKYLSKHMILSHGEKKHKCQLCGKAFAFSQQLKMHERTHTVENPYPANYYPTYPIGPTFW